MITNNAKQSLLKIAERMTRSFLSGVATSNGDIWFGLSGNGGNTVRAMTRKSLNDPGRPVGVILYASTSFWLPVPPKTVFDFLRDANNRTNVSTFFGTITPLCFDLFLDIYNMF